MFKKILKLIMLSILMGIILGILIVSTASVVYADTNGKELKITAQPDKLVLQLGKDWAGVEFELKLDSGTFPVPVKANSSGMLTMELGGSKTYTLTRITPPPAPVPAPEPIKPVDTTVPAPTPLPTEIIQPIEDIQENEPEDPIITEAETTTEEINPAESIQDEPEPPDNSVPVIPMIIFFSLLIIAAGTLLFIRALNKRREYYDDNDYEDDEGNENESDGGE